MRILKIFFSKWTIAIILFCWLGHYVWIYINVSYSPKFGFVTTKEKIDIALKEFLAPERQAQIVTNSLSFATYSAMDLRLCKTTNYVSCKGKKWLKTHSFFDQKTLDNSIPSSELIKIIPYSSLGEFKKNNPDCCQTKIMTDADKCYVNKVEGGLSWRRGHYTCVYIDAKLHYLDENDKRIERTTRLRSAAMINNEGEIVHWDILDF